MNASVESRFGTALDGLVEQIKQDGSILAAILCGSLSYDRVWAKSDIDLALVTTDDGKVKQTGVALYADGVNVHALLMTRADFRKMVEGSLRNSFAHSFISKGRLLYAHDDTIAELMEGLHVIGGRDAQLRLLRAGISALPPIYKAHKWMKTRGDLDYTALWILYAATPLAEIEVIQARQLVDREVIPQAVKLNPGFFGTVYVDVLNGPKTHEGVQAALDAIDGYVAERAPSLFSLVLEYLEDVQEARSSTEIEDWFQRNHGVTGVTTACEYLADQGWIGKAGAPLKLTKKSSVQVQELAFFHLEGRAVGR